MSASMCIKCERMVMMYEKYCSDCVKRYGVKQDPLWHKTHWFEDWDADREREFRKDVAANVHFNVSKDVMPETIDALEKMAVLVTEEMSSKKHKPRKRHKKQRSQ